MSWFDTSGLTSLAKSALKEAQKTIDKALDIQADGSSHGGAGTVAAVQEKTPEEPTSGENKENSDFFSSWGLTASDSMTASNSTSSSETVVTQSPLKATSQSLWGSFTGSFFENASSEKNDANKESKAQLEMIVDDSNEPDSCDEPFSKSKLVMHGMSDDGEGNPKHNLDEKQVITEKRKLSLERSSVGHIDDLGKSSNGDGYPITMRRASDRQSTSYINRLSIASLESGKNSSESIEVLGSQSLKTTPDSESTSLNHSASGSGSMGLKLASSSVEVLPDSLMSPSSIELLGFSSNSEEVSRASDEEFRSPLTSPIDNESSLNTKIGKKSSTDEDIKVLADVNDAINDDEDVSAADDTISYNSISEFTAPTILDSNLPNKSVDNVPRKLGTQFSNELKEGPSPDYIGNVVRSSDDLPITKAPSRNSAMFSTSQSSSNQNVQKAASFSESMMIIQPGSSQNTPLPTDTSSNDGSWSDRTLNAESDAVTMESSLEESFVKSSLDKSTTSLLGKSMLDDGNNDKLSDKASDSSSYCKMGESVDAIHPIWKEHAFSSSSQSYEEIEKASIDQLEHVALSQIEFASREPNSPGSSESRSGDIVKVGSEQTSGHTSGDDLETTTSSDIEIIPSPNGDYGSIYSLSRHSPAKLPGKFCKQSGNNVVDLVLGKSLASKIRGHNRELSEASNQSNTSDDSHCSENERLMRRLAEMTDILESREAKLIEVSRKNIELTESNTELKANLESMQGKQDGGDVTLITEEYTQRLSALEKKFQQAIRDKDILRKQMETFKHEAATRLTSGELENAVSERDETIKELREEGEKLSKQQLHHSTIIKRLRTKEKENEQVIKTLRDKVADQAQELDRLKRSISAKEAVECTQIETVFKLTAANKKLETELCDTKGSLDDTNKRLETVKTSLDAAKKELIELQRNSGDLAKRQETLAHIEQEKVTMESDNEQLAYQLDELRNKMRQDEQRWMNREASLRAEVSRLLARAEEAESSLQLGGGIEGGAGGGEGGPALLAQLAALQETSLERDLRAQARERQLQQATADAQAKCSKLVETNQLLREECQSLRLKLSTTEASLAYNASSLENIRSTCEQQMAQLNSLTETNERLKEEFDKQKQQMVQSNKEISERLQNVEHHLILEKATCEAEKKRSAALQEQLHEAVVAQGESSSSLLLARLVGGAAAPPPPAPPERPDSPEPHGSTAGDSLASDSLGSGVWPFEEAESVLGSMSLLGAGVGDGGVCTLEHLQAALQQREGELRAARRAGKHAHAQRTALTHQLALHASQLDTMQSVQHQYDALLQMYGEKEEQLAELRLDLQDVKDMYKMQLDEILLLKRQAAEREAQRKQETM